MKKPKVILPQRAFAVQFTGTNMRQIVEFSKNRAYPSADNFDDQTIMKLNTEYGLMTVGLNDYVVRDYDMRIIAVSKADFDDNYKVIGQAKQWHDSLVVELSYKLFIDNEHMQRR